MWKKNTQKKTRLADIGKYFRHSVISCFKRPAFLVCFCASEKNRNLIIAMFQGTHVPG